MMFCCCTTGPTFSCNSCLVPGTIYVTDPVYGVKVALTATTIAGNTSWSGSGSISFPGFAGGAGGVCPAATVTIAYVFQCSLGTLKVTCGRDPRPTEGGLCNDSPGTACPPNFTLSGVFSPMTCSKLSFTCHGVGSFDAVYSGTTAGSFPMSNLFQVDTNQHSFSFALSSTP